MYPYEEMKHILGYQRCRLLSCFSADNPKMPLYFNVDLSKCLLGQFKDYAKRVAQILANENDCLAVSLVAALKLLNGDIHAALIILDHLPDKPVKLDHGAGYCQIVHLQALSFALPFPPSLKNWNDWISGSEIESCLKAWLIEHKDRLHWNDTEGQYKFEE